MQPQFNCVFALLISMLYFKSINFYPNRPKIKLRLQKNTKFLSPGGCSPMHADPRNSSSIVDFWLCASAEIVHYHAIYFVVVNKCSNNYTDKLYLSRFWLLVHVHSFNFYQSANIKTTALVYTG